jgi:type I restriction enzyme S subunit
VKYVPLMSVSAHVSERVSPFLGSRPYLATGDLSDDGTMSPTNVTFSSKPARADLCVRPRDVCFARMQCTEKVFEFGVRHENLILSTGFVVLRPNPEVVDSAYLRQWLKSPSFQASKDANCSGATQKAVTNEAVQRLMIPNRPLDDQRHIAAVLDQTDAVRATRAQAILGLNEFETALFIESFGDSSAWPTATVAEIACPQPSSIRTGPFGSQLLHSEFTSEGVAVLGIDNVVANEFRWGERRFVSPVKHKELRRYTVRPGDVLITIMGTCGRCAVVPDDIPLAINTKHLCCITLDRAKCLPSYLQAYFLRHPDARTYLEQRAKGAIMAGLNMGIIRDMPVALPPLSSQVAFEQRLGAIRRLRESQRHSQERMHALHAALQEQFFGQR